MNFIGLNNMINIIMKITNIISTIINISAIILRINNNIVINIMDIIIAILADNIIIICIFISFRLLLLLLSQLPPTSFLADNAFFDCPPLAQLWVLSSNYDIN